MIRRALLLVLICTTAALGLSSVSKRKSYSDGQILTAADYNADRDEDVTWQNQVRAHFPGTDPNDSTKTTIGAHDTLVAKSIAKIMVKHPLISVESADSLVYDWAHVDTLWIGTTTGPIAGFVGGTTAGSRLNLGSLVRADSVWAGTSVPTVGFGSGFTAGVRVRIPYANTDSLVGVDTLNATAARLTRLHLSAAPVGVSYSDFASAGVRMRRAYADVDSLVGVDKFLVGTTTPTVGYAGAASAGNRFTFGSLVAIDSLRVRDSLTVAGPATLTGGGRFGAALVPTSSDGAALGSASLPFSDAFLAIGGVLNWANGDVTATHSANTLTFTGATSGYSFTGTGPTFILGGGTSPFMLSGSSAQAIVFNMATSLSGGGNTYGHYLDFTASENATTLYQINVLGGVAASKTLGEWRGIRIQDPAKGAGATLTTATGLYIDDITQGGTNYSVFLGTGTYRFNGLNASQDVQTDGSKNLVTVSDSTWKINHGAIDPDSAIVVLEALQPRYYKWKKSGSGLFDAEQIAAQPRLGGFYAQEVYSAFPEGSPGGPNTDENGVDHWGLNSSSILAVTVAAGQRMNARIDSLAAVTAAQRVTIDSLRALHP